MVGGVVLGTIALLAAGSGTTAAAPTLRVADREPLIVVGDHFAPGERVSVTALTTLGPRTTRVVAVRGRFRVEFAVPSKGCGAAFGVRARRANGTVVVAALPRAPVCVPPPRD